MLKVSILKYKVTKNTSQGLKKAAGRGILRLNNLFYKYQVLSVRV